MAQARASTAIAAANTSEPEGAFDDKRKSSEKLASFSGEAGEASFSELFGVIEQSFL